MLKTLFLTFVFTVALFAWAYTQKTEISVLTYNIRYANPGDAPNTWQFRKQSVFSQISQVSPDVFGLQEALVEQVKDMENAFPAYSRVGVGRDDGKEGGEFSPVFFNSGKFNLLNSGTFWLSQTPYIAGSRGWDAACNRVVTWVNLKEKKTGRSVFVFCTHFDHMGELARHNSALLLLKAVDSLSASNPAIVLGDFNATPDSEPYKLITANTDPRHLTDAAMMCKDISGPEITYSGFKVGGIPGERIDYIFVKRISHVIKYKVNDSNNGEYYPSDHLPVNASLQLF